MISVSLAHSWTPAKAARLRIWD